jgi:hypothetical protein
MVDIAEFWPEQMQAPRLNIYCSARSMLSQICKIEAKICKALAPLRGPIRTWYFEKAKIRIEATVIEEVGASPHYRGAPPSVPPANASVAAADRAAL